MPTRITATTVTQSGVAGAGTAAAADGNKFLNTPGTVLVLINGSGATRTFTVSAQRTAYEKPGYGSIPVNDLSITVATLTRKYVYVPPALYNDGNGDAFVAVDTITTVTYDVIQPQLGA